MSPLPVPPSFPVVSRNREGIVARHLAIVVLLCALAVPAHAQVARPRGVTVRDAAIASNHAATADRRIMADTSSQRRGSVWPWLGIGAVSGAAIGGVIAAVQISRADDVFVPGVVVGIVAGIGAVVGALLGAIAYTVTP